MFLNLYIYINVTSESWEIDPTDPDDEGAGAEDGAVGGDSAGEITLPPPPQLPPDIDTTNPFEPTGGTSTPYPSDDIDEEIEMTNMDLDEMEFDPDDIPLLTDFMTEEDKETALDKPFGSLKINIKKVDFRKLGPIGWGKKNRQ